MPACSAYSHCFELRKSVHTNLPRQGLNSDFWVCKSMFYQLSHLKLFFLFFVLFSFSFLCFIVLRGLVCISFCCLKLLCISVSYLCVLYPSVTKPEPRSNQEILSTWPMIDHYINPRFCSNFTPK